MCTLSYDFLVQTTWEHTSKQQGLQPNHLWEEIMKHNYYCFVASLRCDKTFSLKRYTLWFLVSSPTNIITLLWFSPSKVRDTVNANMPSLVQRGRRDTAVLIPDLGYRQWEEWSHHTQPIYPQERDQVLNIEARWAPGPTWMRMVKRISSPTGVWASVSHTNYLLQTSEAQ